MARDPALTALHVGLVVARSVGGDAESVRQAQNDRVSQRPVRLAMRRDHESNEIVGSPPSATDGVHDALTLLGAQPERGFAGVADVAGSSPPSRNVSGRRPSRARHPSTTTRCSRRCLCLTHAALRRPLRYRASSRLKTTPSRPAALVPTPSPPASSTKCAGTIQRPPSRSSSSRSERRARYGSPRVESPPTC